jgi:hypothetical protein
MVSALLYLRLLQRQYEFKREGTTTNMTICDNEGLLKRIEAATEWTYTTTNVTLRAEWDIESFILEILTELKIKFIYMPVHSHQDDATPFANQSFESQLNVEADQLATAYIQKDHRR